MIQTPQFTLEGNLEEAKQRRQTGLQQLAILKNAMKFGDLKQDLRKVRYTDGSEILCTSNYGIDKVKISVPHEVKIRKSEFYILSANRKDSITDENTVIQLSRDGGITWEDTFGIPNIHGHRTCKSIAVWGNGTCIAGLYHPYNPDPIYRSSDGGKNWETVSWAGDHTGKVNKVSYLGNNVCFAGGTMPSPEPVHNFHEIYRSTDDGLNWVTKGYVMREILGIANWGNNVAAVGHANWAQPTWIYSTDRGANWHLSQMLAIESCIGYTALAITETVGLSSTISLGSHNLIWRTPDCGQWWGCFEMWPSSRELSGAYAIGHFGDGLCLVGTGYTGCVFRSEDYGATWTDMGYAWPNTLIYSFLMLGKGRALLGMHGGIIKETLDYGTTWNTISIVPDSAAVHDLQVVWITSRESEEE